MFCEDAENKTKAVLAVRDDRIRKDGMGRRTQTRRTDKPADVQGDPYRFVVDEIDESALIIGVDPKGISGTTKGTDCLLSAKMVHAF